VTTDADLAASPPDRPDGWWRRNRYWLLGALLLGAIAFVWPYRDALHEYQRWRPHDPIDVAKGEWAHYAGARWRLVDASLKTATGPGSAFDLQRLDSSVLVLRYEVIPDPGTDAEKLDSCKGLLFDDAHGREWENNPLPLSRYRNPQRWSDMCGSRLGADFKRQLARPGRAFVFEHLYQLPRSVEWRRMRAGISVPDPELVADQGSYLRFSLQ
jgi:hypothetical protein